MVRDLERDGIEPALSHRGPPARGRPARPPAPPSRAARRWWRCTRRSPRVRACARPAGRSSRSRDRPRTSGRSPKITGRARRDASAAARAARPRAAGAAGRRAPRSRSVTTSSGRPGVGVAEAAAVRGVERAPPRGAVRHRQLVRLPGVAHVERRLEVGPVHPVARDRSACGARQRRAGRAPAPTRRARPRRSVRRDVAERLGRQRAPRRQQAGMARHEHAAHAERRAPGRAACSPPAPPNATSVKSRGSCPRSTEITRSARSMPPSPRARRRPRPPRRCRPGGAPGAPGPRERARRRAASRRRGTRRRRDGRAPGWRR